MSRSTLIRLFGGLICVAVFAVLGVFTQTFKPSAGTDAALPRIPVNNIAPSTFAFVPSDVSSPWAHEIMFVRSPDGKLAAWFIPSQDGVHRLPDGHWWRPGYPCTKYQVDFGANEIRCGDSGLPEWVSKNFRWSLDGKSKSNQAPDMQDVPGVEESGFFVLHKWKS